MLSVIQQIALIATVSCATVAWSQSNYIPVSAPYAETLVVNTKAAHKELRKLGIHAIPPGQQAYAIIANGIPNKVGKKSSDGDLLVVHTGKPTLKKDEKGQFFDLALPIADATGKQFGLTVMEIPYHFAKDSDDALAKAIAVRDEMQSHIPTVARLYEQADALKPGKTMPLIGIKTKWDHFGLDLAGHRLFATAEDEHEVLVLNLETGEKIGEIHGVAKPHAVFYRSDNHTLYVTDGTDGALKVFDDGSYKLKATIRLRKDADSIAWDAARNYLYVVSGGKDGGQKYSFVSVVDTNKNAKVTDIRIEGETLEAMYADVWRPRLYVNNEANNSVVVVDRWKNTISATWPITMGKQNVAMAADEQHQRLFVGCRNDKVIVLDSNTGKELQTLDIPSGVDDMVFDAASKRLYVIGDGFIATYEQDDADHYTPMARVRTAGPAKTGTLVTAMNRYYAAIPSSDKNGAAVAWFEPVNVLPQTPEETPKKEMVHAPKALEIQFATMSAHPDLRKMGLHAAPPGGHRSVIVANLNTSRIGIASSDGDLSAVEGGKTYSVRREDGEFYNVKEPLRDASGRIIGILVMEIPWTSVPDEAGAVREGESIGSEVAQRIPSYESLFQ